MNYTRVGVRDFAEPLFGDLPRDPATHKINLSVCFEHTFGAYYATELVGNLFDCLYDATCNPFAPYNTTGNATKVIYLQKEMEKFWLTASAYFAPNQFVLGYDILNEPAGGNIYAHPWTYIDTAKFEKEYLQPLFRTMMADIWAND